MRKQGQEGEKEEKEQALESKTVDATMAVQTVGKQDYFVWQCCENNIAAERQLYTALEVRCRLLILPFIRCFVLLEILLWNARINKQKKNCILFWIM